MIIEQVSGMAYEDFLEQNIFEPLGMLNSGYSIDWDTQKNKAQGHEIINEEFIINQYEQYFLFAGAGGLYTTVNDLAKWDRALYSEQIFKKATIEKSYDSYIEIPNSTGYGYGYGWFARGNRVEHSGLLPGYTSYIYRELDSQLVIIFLSNSEVLAEKRYDFTRVLLNLIK
ncbi:beta-lactamase family protein [Chengkuizengella sediminis]|nr:beta-lactamase family protein [Chengkuizengella sediminis]